MSGKAKLPKTIAGLKVPKALRQSGWLDALVASPEGRTLLAEALLRAAEAAAAVLTSQREDAGSDAAEPAEAEPAEVDAAEEEEQPVAPKPRGRRRSRRGGEVAAEDDGQTAAPSVET